MSQSKQRLSALRQFAGRLGGSRKKTSSAGLRRRKNVHGRATLIAGVKQIVEFGISREEMVRAERHFWLNPLKPWRREIYVPSAFKYNTW